MEITTLLRFKGGDRVRVKNTGFDGYTGLIGKEGTVRMIKPPGPMRADYGVEFDEPFQGGHNLNGFLSSRNRGRFGWDRELELAADWDE